MTFSWFLKGRLKTALRMLGMGGWKSGINCLIYRSYLLGTWTQFRPFWTYQPLRPKQTQLKPGSRVALLYPVYPKASPSPSGGGFSWIPFNRMIRWRYRLIPTAIPTTSFLNCSHGYWWMSPHFMNFPSGIIKISWILFALSFYLGIYEVKRCESFSSAINSEFHSTLTSF